MHCIITLPCCVSEWFIKPSSSSSSSSHRPLTWGDEEEPIHLTPFELVYLNLNYSQKGLLFAKPPPPKEFSITAFLDDLRRSLSDTLTNFHPLAGRLATRKQPNSSYVIYLDPQNSCSPGVKFVYANTSSTVSDILGPNDVTLFHPFFHLNHAINHDGHTLPLLSVQVTELVDGIFIGGSINHAVADGTSFWRFMHSWSQTYNNTYANASSCFIRTPIKGCDPIINLPFTRPLSLIHRTNHHSSSTGGGLGGEILPSSISKLKAKVNAEANNA